MGSPLQDHPHTYQDGGFLMTMNEIFLRDHFQAFQSNYAKWRAALQWEEQAAREGKRPPDQHLRPYYCS